jgi:hypothetical protein
VRYFDFSDDVERAVWEARDEITRLSARTETGRRLFPMAAARAGFTLTSVGQPFVPGANEHVLVIGIATWSDPDLAALDGLAQNTRERRIKVLVLDIDDWKLDDILRTFPGAQRFRSTPLVLQYKGGVLAFSGEGHDAILWLDQI